MPRLTRFLSFEVPKGPILNLATYRLRSTLIWVEILF